MGYYYTSEPKNAVHPKSYASPKTHVPGSPVKDRGHRYYSAESGRWVNRDPVTERGSKLVISHAFRTNPTRKISDERNLSLFVRNDPVSVFDPTGLMATPPAPAPPSSDPCEVAEKKLKIPIDEGGALVCHDGKLLGCVWNKSQGTYKKFPGLLKCKQSHEDAHVGQNPNVTCELCKTYYYIPDPKKKPERECKASQLEIDCLLAEHKNDCGFQGTDL